MTALIPLDTLNTGLVSLPYFEWLVRHIYAPIVHRIVAGRRQRLVILPSNINDLTRLHELIDGVLLNVVRLPDLDVGLITTGGHQRVTLIPTRVDQLVLRSEQP